ncbi:hypothetical protein HPULCUR_003571 [Helicostylum pulchrum]|uniref:Uncharacterized protein n=1 Tax=Helicostylum pulchrum TaxID=562976 RepID=A0ABP9XTS0_9FUNG
MHPPFHYGISPHFVINAKDAQKVDLPVSRWTSNSELIKRAFDHNPESDEKSYDNFKATFDTISKLFIDRPTLAHFSAQLVEYMNAETTRDKYNDAFEDAIIERRLAVEEKRVRKRIEIRQIQILVKDLSAEIGLPSTIAEKMKTLYWKECSQEKRKSYKKNQTS